MDQRWPMFVSLSMLRVTPPWTAQSCVKSIHWHAIAGTAAEIHLWDAQLRFTSYCACHAVWWEARGSWHSSSETSMVIIPLFQTDFITRVLCSWVVSSSISIMLPLSLVGGLQLIKRGFWSRKWMDNTPLCSSQHSVWAWWLCLSLGLTPLNCQAPEQLQSAPALARGRFKTLLFSEVNLNSYPGFRFNWLSFLQTRGNS